MQSRPTKMYPACFFCLEIFLPGNNREARISHYTADNTGPSEQAAPHGNHAR